MWVLVAQLCSNLCGPIDCSPPSSSAHEILKARILGWVAIPFSKGSFWPRDRTWVSRIAGRFFNIWTTREAHSMFLLAIYFIYSSVYMSIPISQFTPPPPFSPLVTISFCFLHLWLYFCFINWFICTIFFLMPHLSNIIWYLHLSDFTQYDDL